MAKHTERAVPDSTQVKTQYANRSQAVVDLGLEHYVMQLEVDGLCVVPPEVHGVDGLVLLQRRGHPLRPLVADVV